LAIQQVYFAAEIVCILKVIDYVMADVN